MKINFRKAMATAIAVSVCLAPWGAGAGPAPAKKKFPDPPGLVEIRPQDFDGVDVCLRDTSGENNVCSREYGVVKQDGGQPERICKVGPRALEGLKKARAELKKVNKNYELIVISSYRSPGYQQCLWAKPTGNGYKCSSAICGAKNPETGAKMACNRYDLDLREYEEIYDHCPHVNMNTVDLCAYDRTKVNLNDRNQIDMTILDDCRKSKDPNYKPPEGFYYHPCTCRFTDWTSDMRNGGSARTKKIFKRGGAEEQKAMIAAMRATGWTDNAPGEWWHFKYIGK